MTETEHRLVKLAEECNEVAQRCTKAIRFGLLEVQEGQQYHNKARIRVEMAALIMIKLGVNEVTITPEDIHKIADGNKNIVLDARRSVHGDNMVLRIVDSKTAQEMARQEGGRPQDC